MRMSRVEELETPVVTILLDRLEENIRRVQQRIAGHGLANRPHIKTHKIPEIAKLQLAAGAVGITCQKLGEVETFVAAGLADDILLTYNIVGPAKTERLMALARKVRQLTVVADSEIVVRGLSEAAVSRGTDIRLLVECDTGFGRNGVQRPEDALELARLAGRLPGVAFRGLMVFPNTAPNTGAFMRRSVELFAAAGIPLPVVSGGGTPALRALAEFPMMTEHRAGTYVYNDVMMVQSGVADWGDCAMHIRATVVSRPTADRAVIDSGSKILTSDQYYVKNYGRIVEYPGAVIPSLSEEHAIVDLSACAERPSVGDVVNVIPNHCCAVSNMVDEVCGIRDGRVEVVWPVAARGKVR
jgi:D-serine deaminase-like pyridoxal phosphate-dependent protein